MIISAEKLASERPPLAQKTHVEEGLGKQKQTSEKLAPTLTCPDYLPKHLPGKIPRLTLNHVEFGDESTLETLSSRSYSPGHGQGISGNATRPLTPPLLSPPKLSTRNRIHPPDPHHLTPDRLASRNIIQPRPRRSPGRSASVSPRPFGRQRPGAPGELPAGLSPPVSEAPKRAVLRPATPSPGSSRGHDSSTRFAHLLPTRQPQPLGRGRLIPDPRRAASDPNSLPYPRRLTRAPTPEDVTAKKSPSKKAWVTGPILPTRDSS